MRRSFLVPLVPLVVFAAACTDDALAPAARKPSEPIVALAAPENQGPPAPHRFGPDTYRIGFWTGQGITQPGLSCTDQASGVRECTGFLPSDVDGALLDVTLQIPASAPQPVPLVTVIHGYAGSKTSSGDVVQPLLAEGYAVLRYSTRGFGESWGQVNMVDVHAEVADMRSMIGQVIDNPDYHLDKDHVAITGASYGGGHSWMGALEPTFATATGTTVTIATIVPIAAWSDLLYSLIPNGRERESIDRPGGAKLSYINGLYASGIRRNPDRPYNNYPLYFIGWHAWINAEEPNNYDPVYRGIIDGLAGYRSIWWQQPFWDAAQSTHIPIFVVQGFTDDLFPLPEAKRMVLALQKVDPAYPVALYLGDIGHPRASNKTGEVDYVLDLIKSWLAWYLKGSGSQPANQVYAALTRPRDEDFAPANVKIVPTLGALTEGSVEKAFALPAVLVNPLTDPAGGFFWDPFVMEGARELRPLPVPPESPTVPGSLATYDVPVSELTGGAPLYIAGQPSVSLHATTPSSRVQLDVRLFDVDLVGGTKQLVTRGTYTAASRTPGMPLGAVDLVIPTYGNYWRAEAGHLLRLELTNVDSPYIAPSRVPSTTIVTDVRLTVPFGSAP